MCLENGLRALHPMMPFITEELYQKLPEFPDKKKSITIAPYPRPLEERYQGFSDHFRAIEEEFEKVNKIAGCLRSIAAGVNLPPQIKAAGFIITDIPIVKEQTALLATLGRCSKITLVEDEKQIPKGCGTSNFGTTKIFLELGSHIDFAKEIERLGKKLTQLEEFKANLQKKFDDPNRNKIPEKLKLEQEKQMENFLKEEAILQEALGKIKALQ